MEQTKIFTALKGVRGRKPVDLGALENLLVQFSQLVVEQRWIKEIDINPLLASPERLLALDARVVLHEPLTHEDELPQCVIRSYPTQYVADWQLKDGTSDHDPPHPARGRTADGQVPHHPVRPHGLPALPACAQAQPAPGP